jgi:hypothetical protein
MLESSDVLFLKRTRASFSPRRKEDIFRVILAITLEATPGTHDEGRLVLAFVRATGLFLSFGAPLSYRKLLFRGLSIGSAMPTPALNDRGETHSSQTHANIAHDIIRTY